MEKVIILFQHEFDPYGFSYRFEHMVAAICIENDEKGCLLETYEDMCIVAEAIVRYWIYGKDAVPGDVYELKGWLAFQSKEEEGYIHAYAERVAEKFIDAYLVYLGVLHEKK